MPSLLAARRPHLVGTDYNSASIVWNRAHLPGVEFVENGLEPPLDLAEGVFDVVYCISVFTHLSEDVQLAWAAELARVLKPGGLLICTTQGDAFRHMLVTASERATYDAGEVVALGNYREGRKYFLAIHPERFVREKLLARYAGVRRVQTRAMAFEFFQQDTWIGWKDAVPTGAEDRHRYALPRFVELICRKSRSHPRRRLDRQHVLGHRSDRSSGSATPPAMSSRLSA